MMFGGVSILNAALSSATALSRTARAASSSVAGVSVVGKRSDCGADLCVQLKDVRVGVEEHGARHARSGGKRRHVRVVGLHARRRDSKSALISS